MNPHISFHLTDRCNIRCKQCHWFSYPVTDVKEVPHQDYINWIKKYPEWCQRVRFTGGEPTEYPEFIELVEAVPTTSQIQICSNGINIDVLKKIKRKVVLTISINRSIDEQFKSEIKNLGHLTSFVTYLGPTANLKNELNFADTVKHLIGCEGTCQQRYIRFAANGIAYRCETGMRSKEEGLKAGFSLWEGTPHLNALPCKVRESCPSNFLVENTFIKT